MLKKHTERLGSAIFAALLAVGFGNFSMAAAEPDRREASINCALDKSGQLLECEYRHTANLVVKEVSLHIARAAVQIPAKSLAAYPSPQQSTAVLFLVDVSDPKRKNTVEKKNAQAIVGMLANIKPHQKVGLAVFDSDLRVLSPISADSLAVVAAANTVKASGQATEFYKNILAAIAILQKTDASRKGLIIMSDGKAGDTAYTHGDAIKAARDAGIVILGMGYTERPSDSPSLQTIKKLAEESYGVYFDATTQTLPAAQAGKPFSFVEQGGRFSLPVAMVRGPQPIVLTLRLNEGSPLELKTEVDFPDRRTQNELAIDFGKQYWPALLAGFFVSMGIVLVFLRFLRRRRLAAKPVAPYALLTEMAGSGTQYPLSKKAVCIGRSTANDICLNNDTISSRHAEITQSRTGAVHLFDLASANGVYVNETKVTQLELHDGDVIELGEVRLRFTAH